MNFMVLLAGGIGSRVGAGIPKQFVDVLGKPVIAYTLQRFQDHPDIDGIEIVCLEGFQEKMMKIVDDNHITKVIKIVAGGNDFQHSVMNGVEGLKGIASSDDIIMIHWAASPFVSDEIISDGIRVCKEKGNSISACPFYLLAGNNVDGVLSDRYIDRDTVMIMSAPQSFTYSYVREMYAEAVEKGLIDQVEPHTTTLMYKMGRKIYFSKGNQLNIKITTKEDLDLLKRVILGEKLIDNV